MVSGIVTATLLVVFLAGWAWAWSPRRRRDFEEAARLPLDEGDTLGEGRENER
ncbi:cbb3-type cytochrome oxidase subunit 3 [Lysobacter yangpyeongensis]|jgi:cytochrome c oxidase cbb3-type subunit 4|uniref:Cbb3-type cytochrome oxidase subunit 3 n=1 Tax=Lysobacter yangpyeongensis TaxID=346182 RepID=A0ABW0SI67_9GAMM